MKKSTLNESISTNKEKKINFCIQQEKFLKEKIIEYKLKKTERDKQHLKVYKDRLKNILKFKKTNS